MIEHGTFQQQQHQVSSWPVLRIYMSRENILNNIIYFVEWDDKP